MRHRRLLTATAFSITSITAVIAVIDRLSAPPKLSTDLLLFLGIVVGAALIGGFVAGVATAVVSFPTIVWFLTKPVHSFRIAGGEEFAALVVFFSLAVIVSALVDQVARRSADAESARGEAATLEAAAEGDKLRTAILRAVSHDLRTPLASIKASASSLLQEDSDGNDHERREFLTTIDEEADRLDRIVGNLLDLSRLQAGVVRPELTNVTAIVAIRNAIGGIGAENANILINVKDDDLEVAADQVFLERAIANLVANSVRHGAPDTPIEIQAMSKKELISIVVIDHGPGMNEADRALAFEPFHTAGDQTSGAGTGLGLAVAHGFVEAMDGSITLQETPGGGLTAIISLPSPAGDSAIHTRSVSVP